MHAGTNARAGAAGFFKTQALAVACAGRWWLPARAGRAAGRHAPAEQRYRPGRAQARRRAVQMAASPAAIRATPRCRAAPPEVAGGSRGPCAPWSSPPRAGQGGRRCHRHYHHHRARRSSRAARRREAAC